MSLEKGIPKARLLAWAYQQIVRDSAFTHAVYDEERVFFTVQSKSGVERRYKLTIERGRPVVEQVDGPAETR